MTDRDKLIEAMARSIALAAGAYEGPEFDWRAYEGEAQAALAAHEAWLEAQGIAVVPVEPTEAMIDAGHALDPLGCDVQPDSAGDIYGRIWFGMIQAARGGV